MLIPALPSTYVLTMQAETLVQSSKRDYEDITQTLKKEISVFEKTKVRLALPHVLTGRTGSSSRR